MECAYHHHDDWSEASALPLTSFLGRALYLKFTDLGPRAYITPEDLERVSAARVRPGDIVILDSPYRLSPSTQKTNSLQELRLLVNAATALWLRDKQV